MELILCLLCLLAGLFLGILAGQGSGRRSAQSYYGRCIQELAEKRDSVPSNELRQLAEEIREQEI